MKTTIKSVWPIIIIFLLASCVGSRKIDFDTAYKFSTYTYQKSMNQEKSKNDAPAQVSGLSVSTNAKIPTKPEMSLAVARRNLYEKLESTGGEVNVSDISSLTNKIDQLDRKEKRVVRKELKEELKKMEAEKSYSANDTDQVNEFSDYTRISIIVGSVGLVLLLLGALFSVSFLSIFGALAIVGAAVLFIIDQV